MFCPFSFSFISLEKQMIEFDLVSNEQALLPHTSKGNADFFLRLLLLVLEYQGLLLHVVSMMHHLRCPIIILRLHFRLSFLFFLINLEERFSLAF